jgi:hypothetical protein
MSGVQFSTDGKPVIFNSGTGNVMPFQDLTSDFQGVDANGAPIRVNPAKWQRGQVSVNPNGGVTQRVVVGGSEGSFQVIEDRPQRFRAEDLKQGEGIASSAIGAGGRHLAPHELKADSLVQIKLSDGTVTDTTVANAVSLNLLRPRQGGGYENVEPTQPKAQPQVQQQTTQADPLAQDVAMDEEFIGHTAAVQRGLSHLFVANAINEAVTQGAFSPSTVNAAAKQWETTPEVALSVLQGAQAGHGAAYERYVSANGIRPADFTAFMQKQPETMALLMSQQASSGKTSVWAPMIRQFKSSRGNR